MRQTVDPDFEYDRGPVLWGAATVVALGLLVNFVLARPGWLIPVALVGGGVAAARSEFYAAPANNGAVAVILGTAILIPPLSIMRSRIVFGIDAVGDTVFYALALSVAWIAVLLVVLAPMGYLGGWAVDSVRRRVGGSIGY